jgi:hypothetical protein
MHIINGLLNSNLKIVYFFLCLYFLAISANGKEKFVFSTASAAPIQEISEQVLHEAYYNIGFHIRVEPVPIARSLILSNKGYFDGELSRVEGIDKEFRNLLRVPVAINFIEAYAFIKNSDFPVLDWETIHPYRLVCVNGVKFIRRKMEHTNNNCHFVTTYTQAVNLIQLGRYDIAVIPKINGMAVINKEKLVDIKKSANPLIKLNLYHYIHKKNRDIIPTLTEELIKMEVNGRILAIRQTYIEDNGLQ